MKTSETKLQLQSIDYDIDEDVSADPQPSTSKMIEKKATSTKQLSSSSSSAYNVANALSGMCGAKSCEIVRNHLRQIARKFHA